MKGLIIKDFSLLKNQKIFFIAIVILALITLIAGMDPMFIVSYTTLVLSMFTLSTLSYDEYDNGYPFLFSLPITRKTYVIEKYAFGFLISFGTWMVTLLLSTLYQLIKTSNFDIAAWLLSCAVFLVMIVFLNSLMIPLQLKFGGEKGKIAIFGVFIMVAILGFVIAQVSELLGIDWMLILNQLSNMNLYILMAAVAGVAILSVPISFAFSLKIMNHKQF